MIEYDKLYKTNMIASIIQNSFLNTNFNNSYIYTNISGGYAFYLYCLLKNISLNNWNEYFGYVNSLDKNYTTENLLENLELTKTYSRTLDIYPNDCDINIHLNLFQNQCVIDRIIKKKNKYIPKKNYYNNIYGHTVFFLEQLFNTFFIYNINLDIDFDTLSCYIVIPENEHKYTYDWLNQYIISSNNYIIFENGYPTEDITKKITKYNLLIPFLRKRIIIDIKHDDMSESINNNHIYQISILKFYKYKYKYDIYGRIIQEKDESLYCLPIDIIIKDYRKIYNFNNKLALVNILKMDNYNLFLLNPMHLLYNFMHLYYKYINHKTNILIKRKRDRNYLLRDFIRNSILFIKIICESNVNNNVINCFKFLIKNNFLFKISSEIILNYDYLFFIFKNFNLKNIISNGLYNQNNSSKNKYLEYLNNIKNNEDFKNIKILIDNYIKHNKNTIETNQQNINNTKLNIVNSLKINNIEKNNSKQNNIEQNNIEQNNIKKNNIEQSNTEKNNIKKNNSKQYNIEQSNTEKNNTEKNNSKQYNIEQNNIKQQNIAKNNNNIKQNNIKNNNNIKQNNIKNNNNIHQNNIQQNNILNELIQMSLENKNIKDINKNKKELIIDTIIDESKNNLSNYNKNIIIDEIIEIKKKKKRRKKSKGKKINKNIIEEEIIINNTSSNIIIPLVIEEINLNKEKELEFNNNILLDINNTYPFKKQYIKLFSGTDLFSGCTKNKSENIKNNNYIKFILYFTIDFKKTNNFNLETIINDSKLDLYKPDKFNKVSLSNKLIYNKLFNNFNREMRKNIDEYIFYNTFFYEAKKYLVEYIRTNKGLEIKNSLDNIIAVKKPVNDIYTIPYSVELNLINSINSIKLSNIIITNIDNTLSYNKSIINSEIKKYNKNLFENKLLNSNRDFKFNSLLILSIDFDNEQNIIEWKPIDLLYIKKTVKKNKLLYKNLGLNFLNDKIYEIIKNNILGYYMGDLTNILYVSQKNNNSTRLIFFINILLYKSFNNFKLNKMVN